MIIDSSSGNAIGSFDKFHLAAGALKMIVRHDPTAADECVIIEFDKDGIPTNACRYEDIEDYDYV